MAVASASGMLATPMKKHMFAVMRRTDRARCSAGRRVFSRTKPPSAYTITSVIPTATTDRTSVIS